MRKAVTPNCQALSFTNWFGRLWQNEVSKDQICIGVYLILAIESLASRAGRVVEIVEDEVTEFLVEPGDVAGLAATKIRATTATSTTALAGQINVQKHFTMQATMRRIETAIGVLEKYVTTV